MTNSFNLAEQQERLNRLLGYVKQDPENLLLIGVLFDQAMLLRELSIAEDAINKGLQLSNHDAGWRNRQAILLIAKRQFDDAKAILLELAETGHMESGVQFNLAYIAFCSHQYEQALALANELLSDAALAAEALYLIIRCMHHLKQFKEALLLMDSAHTGNEVSPKVFGAAALLAVDSGDLELAKEFAGKALSRAPDQVDALVAMGTLILLDRDVDQSLQVLTRVLALKPDEGRAQSAIGLCYMQKNDPVQALPYLKSATENMPMHIGTWLALGWCYISQQDLSHANSAFTQALNLDRNFAESHGAYAVCSLMQGQKQLAEEHTERALRLDPRCMSGLYARAILNGSEEDMKQVSQFADQILKQR